MRIEQHMKHSPLNLDILMYSITCWMEEWKIEDGRMIKIMGIHENLILYIHACQCKKKTFEIYMHICYYCIHTAYIGLHVCTYILAYWPYKIKIQLTSLAVLVFSYLDENKPPLLQISVWLCSSSTIFLVQPQLEKLESLVRSFCQNLSHSPSGIHPLLKGKGRKVLLRKMPYFRNL